MPDITVGSFSRVHRHRSLAQAALAHGVIVEPGEIFFAGPERPRNFLRMGYSSIEARLIEDGVQVLAALVHTSGKA